MPTTRGRSGALLYRGNLRNVVILLAVVASLLHPVNDLLRTGIGFGILAFGCLLHILVKGQLIRNVVVSSEGFYGVVRHPYYLASFVIDGSFCVLSGSEALLYLFPFLFFWAYGPSLNKEEQFVEQIHGEVYRDYRAKVVEILPSTGCYRHIPHILRGFSLSRISSQEVKRVVRIAATGTLLATLGGARALWPDALLAWPPAPGLHLRTAVLAGLAVLFYLVALGIPRKRRPLAADEPPQPSQACAP